MKQYKCTTKFSSFGNVYKKDVIIDESEYDLLMDLDKSNFEEIKETETDLLKDNEDE